jgi:rare lipoprotein A
MAIQLMTSRNLDHTARSLLRLGRLSKLRLLLVAAALLSQSCGMIASSSRGSVPELVSIPRPSIAKPEPAKQPELKGTVGVQIGQASWYGQSFAGKPTASGEIFDHELFTAAHRSLPLGARVRVTNVANGKSVEVKVNDRGPYVSGRIIDLSRAAARALGMIENGLAEVRLETISLPGKSQTAKDDEALPRTPGLRTE